MSVGDGKINRLYIHVAGVCFILLVIAMVYVAGVRPWLSNQVHKTELGRALTQSRSEFDKQQLALSDLKAKLEMTRKALEKSPVHLKPASRINDQIALLTELGQEHGLRIELIRPGERSNRDFYDIVPIELAGQGDYGTFTAFLRAVNDKFPTIGVTDFDLTAAIHDEKAAASFKVNLIWFAQPTGVARAENN